MNAISDRQYLEIKLNNFIVELDNVRIKLMIDTAEAKSKKDFLQKEIDSIQKQLNENNK